MPKTNTPTKLYDAIRMCIARANVHIDTGRVHMAAPWLADAVDLASPHPVGLTYNRSRSAHKLAQFFPNSEIHRAIAEAWAEKLDALMEVGRA